MSLASNIQDLATAISTEIKKDRVKINGNAADLSALSTTAKADLVAAINEVFAMAQAATGGSDGAVISDTTTTTTTTWSSSKSQAQIDAAISNILGAAPTALDTLKEIGDALNNDANFAATVTTQLGTKAPIASPAFTGTPTAPTATAGTNTTQVATTAFVVAAVAGVTIPAASATVQGKVELATDAEAQAGTDTARAVTPANLTAVVGNSATNFVTTFQAGLA